MQVSNADRRLTFQVAEELCRKNGLDVKNARPSYGFLRLETPVLDNQTQYQFPILQNQTYNGFNQSPTEQRLALQDNFVVGSKAFYMYFLNTITNKPASRLLTWLGPYNAPSGYAHGALASIQSGAQALIMSGLQNEFWLSAWMRYSFDYNVIIPKYDVLQHHYIPRTEATFNTKTLGAIDPALDLGYPWNYDQFDGSSDGFIPMEPNMILSGAKNCEINYYLPFSLPFADIGFTNPLIVSGDIQPRFCCIYRGVLLQNTTNVK